MNEQQMTNNNKPPNPDLAILKQHFGQYFDKNDVFLLEKFAANLAEQAVDFSTESYGLEWLGKSYARLLASDAATTLLQADEAHNAQSDHALADNVLIQGDNLEVLKHLAHAYYEKVKMIYIDPPYNTGDDDFVYADDRKFTASELQSLMGVEYAQAERISKFTQSKSNTHSAWLTFMYPRLYLAKRLLRDDGVIAIQIDDNEMANLKLLCDEIFGEENLISCVTVKMSHLSGVKMSHSSKRIPKIKEFILFYGKNKYNVVLNKTLVSCSWDDAFDRYNRIIHDIKLPVENWTFTTLKSLLKNIKKENHETWCIDNAERIFRTATNDSFLNKPKDAIFRAEKTATGLNKISFNKEEVLFASDKISIIDGKKTPVTTIGDIWTDIGINNLHNEGYVPFNNGKKPIKLIQRVLQLFGGVTNSIILDFFAGSGTTGDAVMQLNAEDGGNRQFILVQLPEAIDPKNKKTKEAYDFVKNTLQQPEPTIFHITQERLTRAAAKIKTELEEKIAKLDKELVTEETQQQLEQYTKSKTQMGFKVFKTLPIWDNYGFEADTQDPNAVLFQASSLTEDDILTLLTTWKTADGMALTQPLKTVDLGGYVAYCGQHQLYLMHSGFSTEHLKTLLEKLDTEADFQFNSLIAFGHNFDSKTLRELADNLKSYKNKKSSDIEFITRY